jgi:hypothetical protein
MKNELPEAIRIAAALIDARAQLQEDFAAAETRYADALRAIGRTAEADEIAQRAKSHADRAARIRSGYA